MVKTQDIEIAVARHWGTRQNMIIPNVSWGMFGHECDILIVTRSKWGIEVEIKVSKQDIIKDKSKRHKHRDTRLKCLYFAVPNELKDFALRNIPDSAGLICIDDNYSVAIVKNPTPNSIAVKFKDDEYIHLGKLSAMRIWNLTENIRDLARNYAGLARDYAELKKIQLHN